MAETKFTPGPWKAHHGWEHDVSDETTRLHPNWCQITGGDYADNSHISITGHFGMANAHLIAAAPRLYEVLVSVRPIIMRAITANGMSEQDAIESTWLGHLDAVLAKARGEA